MKSLNELEGKFILQEDAEQTNLETQIEKLSNVVQIDKFGFVIPVDRKEYLKLKISDKIAICLAARYLGHKLQERGGKEVSIPIDASASDLSKMVGAKKDVIIARAKDLKDDRKIISSRKGSYQIASHFIDRLIKDCEVDMHG